MRVHPAAAESLTLWHRMVAAQDLSALPALVHPEAVFHSPVAHTPYPGAKAVIPVLRTVLLVFEQFVYERQFVSVDGLNVALEFKALVKHKEVRGIDLMRFDDAGRIVDFEVMVRPASGLHALASAMAERLGQDVEGLRAAGLALPPA